MSAQVKILLVEDHAADVSLVKEILNRTQLSYSLDVVQDGVAALDYLQSPSEASPDFVILDLNLPRKSGRSVLSEMKKREDLKSIPVLVMTTSTSRDDLQGSYEAGANSYLTKPASLEGIRAASESIESFWFTAKEFPNSVQFIRQRNFLPH